MDRFENMNAFVRVVEAGSISAAADRMDVAKSVVSRRLKELEEHLGVELFHRTTRQMNLTDSGRAFYQQSVRILADILEAEHATSQFHGVLKDSLKVAVSLSFGLMHLGPAINTFLHAFWFFRVYRCTFCPGVELGNRQFDMRQFQIRNAANIDNTDLLFRLRLNVRPNRVIFPISPLRCLVQSL